MVSTGFLGWLVDPGPPFEGELLVSSGLSKVLIGPNGYGKSLLLAAIRAPSTLRVFSNLPRRLREEIVASSAELVGRGSAGLSGLLIDELDARKDRAWGLQVTSEGRGRVSVMKPDGRLEGSVSLEIDQRLIVAAIERWIVPDAEDAASLDVRTRKAFGAWVVACLDGVEGTVALGRNPLVGRLADETSVSLLQPAESFADILATRTRDRVAALVGFRLDVKVLPEDDFGYRIRYGREWFPVEQASSALRRWVSLAANETLWEMQRVAEESTRYGDARIELRDFLQGEVPEGRLPRHEIQGFASKSSWIMLDEPEIHLYGSEVRALGKTLAAQSESGRLYIASHSVELASHLVGIGEFLAFSAPGVFDTQGPEDWLNLQLANLAAQGAGALSMMRVLYVEGAWDVKFMELLFAAELREQRIVLCPVNGTMSAGSVATSVWQRMTSAPFGVMFDALSAQRVHAKWQEVRGSDESSRRRIVRALRAEAKRAGRFEDRGMAQLQADILEAGMESRVHFLMHGLSDIFQVASPRAFGGDVDSWADAGFGGDGKFKDFVRSTFRTDLTKAYASQRVFERVRDEGHIDQPAMRALQDEFRQFVAWCSSDGAAESLDEVLSRPRTIDS
ncbi:hypothetical protein [Microbacterium sp.]|uniref:hypothetical protein n=1 Tax=Microbacterium sp. TaxID=51671 RepID=UPI003C732CFE